MEGPAQKRHEGNEEWEKEGNSELSICVVSNPVSVR